MVRGDTSHGKKSDRVGHRPRRLAAVRVPRTANMIITTCQFIYTTSA
jgi:hypothetical protein